MATTGTPQVTEQPAATAHAHAHPTPGDYIRIALVLGIITAMEVATYYFEIVRWAFIGALVVLSTTKFALVVAWYMHLKFDSRMFRRVFVFGLVLALCVFMLVLAIFVLPQPRQLV